MDSDDDAAVNRFAIAAVGVDRPGIVAAVTATLVELECNLEDTAMAILGGHFTMMLLVAAPDGVGGADLDRALTPAVAEFHLELSVRPIDDAAPAAATGDLWTVNVRGADHPGIVHGVTAALASQGANVVDLATRVIDGDGGPVYVMVIDVTLPPGTDGDAFAQRMAEVGEQLGVVCSAHDADADIF